VGLCSLLGGLSDRHTHMPKDSVDPRSGEAVGRISRPRWLSMRRRIDSLSSAIRSGSLEPERLTDACSALIDLVSRDVHGPGMFGIRLGYFGARRRASSLRALALCVERMSASAKSAALAVGRGAWERIADELLESAEADAVRAGLFLIGSVPLMSRAGALARAMAAPDATSELCERGLADMVRLVARPGTLEHAEHLATVTMAVHRAVDGIERHRRAGVLVLAARLCAAGADDGAWLREPGHPAHLVLRGLYRRSRDPALDVAAWRWMRWDAAADACAERLLRAPGGWGAFGRGIDAGAHLAANPKRRRVLRRAAHRHEPERPSASPPGESPARAGAITYLGLFVRGGRWADTALSWCVADPDPWVRHRACREALGLPVLPALVFDLCFDADERVARTAALGLLARTGRDALAVQQRAGLLRALQRSPHASVRHIARTADRAGADPPEPVGPGASEPLEAARAIVAMKRRPDRLLAQRQRVLSAVRRAVEHPDGDPPEVASAWVSLAGELPGDGALHDDVGRALVAATDAPDTRVRANALDALVRRARRAPHRGPEGEGAPPTLRPAESRERWSPALMEVLLRHAVPGPWRVMAASARGLLLAGEELASPTLTNSARATIESLLGAPEPSGRSAGLWLASRLPAHFAALGAPADHVRSLELTAPTRDEAERAAAVARRLSAVIRVSWMGRAQRMQGAGV
jgi:hypothetical protein